MPFDSAGFQSLLCWIGRVKMDAGVGSGSLDLFQSLLCWIGRVKSRRSPAPCPRRASFNPCCVGLAASRSGRGRRQRLARLVSILVVLDWPRQVDRQAREARQHHDVSILVVLDWPRQEAADAIDRLTASMFQSLLCWIGRVKVTSSNTAMTWGVFQSLLCWIGRVNARDPSPAQAAGTVSILVVLDWPRQLGPTGHTTNRGPGFNPCCVGLAASTGRPGRRGGPGRRVSILVVLDWPRQPPRGRRAADPGRVSILVVLDWPRQPAARKHTSHTSACFNPCCVGLAASTLLDTAIAVLATFQSLLCWIGRVNVPPFSPLRSGMPRFQSLFCWIGRVNPLLRRLGRRPPAVSILVVLDWPRQHRARD